MGQHRAVTLALALTPQWPVLHPFSSPYSLVLVKVNSHLPLMHGSDPAVNLAEGLPWEWLCMCNFPEGKDTEGGNPEQRT